MPKDKHPTKNLQPKGRTALVRFAQSRGAKTKTAGMSFTKQDRPEKVKEIYRALKRDHPSMPAEMKARIAARQGKPGKQEQGPPYKGELSKGYSRAARLRDEAKTKNAFEKQAAEAIARAGGNPHIVEIAFLQELEKTSQWGAALGAGWKALAGGAKSLWGGLRAGATGAAAPAGATVGQAAAHQLGAAARGTGQRIGKGVQTHFGVDPRGGMQQFTRDWWKKGLTDAQRRNLVLAGVGGVGAGAFGAGAVAGRATAPRDQVRVVYG
jgi:hypothetical protein